MNDIKQFKLTSGEEIICDVLEYPDEEMSDMVIKDAYQVYMHAQTPDGTRMYTMRPWMLMQEASDSNDNIVVLNSNHILAEANPSSKMVEHYAKVIVHDNSPETTQEDMAEKLAAFINQLRNAVINPASDSDVPTNIVSFPGRTVH